MSRFEALVSSSVAPASSDDTAGACRFFEDAGVIGRDEGPMTLLEMRPYVRGRMTRQAQRRRCF